MPINLNDFAIRVTLREGGAKNVDLAQVKEVIRIAFEELENESLGDVIAVLHRIWANKARRDRSGRSLR